MTDTPHKSQAMPGLKIIRLPGLQKKGDAFDWVKSRRDAGADVAGILEELYALVDGAEVFTPAVVADESAGGGGWSGEVKIKPLGPPMEVATVAAELAAPVPVYCS